MTARAETACARLSRQSDRSFTNSLMLFLVGKKRVEAGEQREQISFQDQMMS